MKRLFIIASLAILAVGCQKTEIQNEVQTPIGFSTEVGKQTRAIVQGTEYPDESAAQPFAVYAYGWHNGTANQNAVMNNVEIGYTAATTGTNSTPEKWSAVGDTKYYWPNDPRTTLNFYAYSPSVNTSRAAHMTLNNAARVVVEETKDQTTGQRTGATLNMTGYVHANKYVDFMLSSPVVGATYTNTDPAGVTANVTEGDGVVPVVFHHQMTQIVFNVKTNQAYNGPVFTVNSIVFNRVNNSATFTQNYRTNYGVWTPTSDLTTFNNVFPALASEGGVTNNEEAKVVTDQVVLTTTPVTMIPQELTDTQLTTSADIIANGGQSFTITYTISGTGVAHETVVKTFEFADASTAWEPNKKITYNLTIGLNEITFAPSVTNWSEEDAAGSFEDDPSNV